MTDSITSFLSFDVEALPGRARSAPVESLIWGRLGGGEYGISRICHVLGQHKLKGNFLIDFSACLLYGDDVVAQIIDFLLSQGHEVHAHLHSEWVARQWQVPGSKTELFGMDRAGPRLSESLLTFTAHKCQKLLKKIPSVFRSGAFMFNSSTVNGAKRCGFAALSNYSFARHGEQWQVPPAATTNEPFVWENGLLELPVDYSPEPLSFDWPIYDNWLARVRTRKREKTNNLVMHSWSLLQREGECFERFQPQHEERLHQICERVKADGEVLTYDEYLRRRDARGTPAAHVPLGICRASVIAPGESGLACNLCGHFFTRPPDNDVCPGCSARTRHRQVQDVMRRIGNPLVGKAVLATFANEVERNGFLRDVASLLNFDVRPVPGIDAQMDLQDLHQLQDGQFDAFFSVHVLNHVKDDGRAVSEIHRVLKPGGQAFIVLPYREASGTTVLDDVTAHYGEEALHKYGVGTYRRYGLEDAVALFAKHFEVRLEPGVDPVTKEGTCCFLLTKPPIS